MLIVDPDAHPTQTLYYAGGLALAALRECDGADVATLFSKVHSRNASMSPDVLTFALDFLFLIGLVELDDDGALRCS